MNACHMDAAALSAFLDGELNAAAREEVRAHLETCGDCRARLREYAALGEFLRAEEMPEPPETLVPGVMRRVRAEKQEGRKRARRRYALLAACAAVALLTVLPGLRSGGGSAPFSAYDNSSSGSSASGGSSGFSGSSASSGEPVTESALDAGDAARRAGTADSGSSEGAAFAAGDNAGAARAEEAAEEAAEEEDAPPPLTVEAPLEAAEGPASDGTAGTEDTMGITNAPDALTLTGEGAAAYLLENGAEASEDGYWVDAPVLRDLPEGLVLSGGDAARLPGGERVFVLVKETEA